MESRPAAAVATLVLGTESDPWQAAFVPSGRAAEHGRMDPGSMRAAVRALRRLRPPKGIQLPSIVAGSAKNERECAAALLGGVLSGVSMQGIGLALAAARGQVGGAPWPLAVDLRSARWRALPWEILEQLGPSHPLSGLRILRLVPTRAARRPRAEGRKLEVLLWAPSDDPETLALARRHRSFLAGLDGGRVQVRSLPASLVPLPGAPPKDVVRVLHVLTHGRFDAIEMGEVLLQLAADREVTTSTAARWLGPLVESTDLAYIEACDGGSTAATVLDAPGPRFVSAGIPVCVAPRWTLPVEMSSRFTQGFYTSINEGGSVLDAVAEGRRRVSETSPSLHRSWRWWNHTCVTSDLSAPTMRPLPGRGVVMPGLPACDSSVDDVCRVWLELGRRTGWLGLEHLALAFAATGKGWAGGAFRAPEKALLEFVSQYDLSDDTMVEPPATPGLVEAARRLDEGFGVPELLAELCRSPAVERIAGRELLVRVARELLRDGNSESTLVRPAAESTPEGAPLARIRAGVPQPGASPHGLSFVVIGGPDDGLRVVLSEQGQALGRQDRKHPEHGVLFRSPRPGTRRVGRRHLRWAGGRRLVLERSAFVERAGVSTVVEVSAGGAAPAEIEVLPGDEVVLDVLLEGKGTRLRVL